MPKNIKLILVFTLITTTLLLGFYIVNQNSATNTDTEEINNFLADAGIRKMKGWEVYPNCGVAGGVNEGYLLEVNNFSIESQQANSLKALAKDRNYKVKERNDGYEVSYDNWNIIALNTGRSDLFATIQYPQKPTGFPEGGRICN